MLENASGRSDAAAEPSGAEIIPFRKAASRLRCLRALRRSHRGGFLLDVGDRYIILSTAPKSGSFIAVDSNGHCRDMPA